MTAPAVLPDTPNAGGGDTVDAALAAARRRVLAVALVIAGGLGLVALAALAVGAVAIAPGRVVEVLAAAAGGEAATGRDGLVILSLRLPRLLLGALVGAGLAVAGVLMQGLFRNPLADPGLIGVSSGAALAAAAAIVLGERLVGAVPFALLPGAAFAGGLASTLALRAIATRDGRTSIATMLLAGIALGAAAGAATGALSFISDDRQLRDLTFWALGSLGGASWGKLMAAAPLIGGALGITPWLARGLNALMLGEAEAFHLGLAVERIKTACVVAVALMVGTAVAVAGAIGFVGIVVPHTLRLIVGPDHRLLLPLSAGLGAVFVVGADLVARLAVAPAELPIGIVTAAIGAPFLLWLLPRASREEPA